LKNLKTVFMGDIKLWWSHHRRHCHRRHRRHRRSRSIVEKKEEGMQKANVSHGMTKVDKMVRR
jgi:hypothetical protein